MKAGDFETTRCALCGEQITFIPLALPGEDGKTKRVACDPGLVPYFYCDPKKTKTHVMTQAGRVVPCEFTGPPNRIINVGYPLHRETCAGRKRGKQK